MRNVAISLVQIVLSFVVPTAPEKPELLRIHSKKKFTNKLQKNSDCTISNLFF